MTPEPGARSRVHAPRAPVELRPAWRRADPKIERDAELFWRNERILPPRADVAARLSYLCVAGYDGDRLIALSEARITLIDFLQVKLAMLRIAVARDVRQHRLGTWLLTESRELLEAWSLENPAEEVMGMGTITQTAAYDGRGRARGYLRDSHLAFVGFTANGEHMRVAWFDHGTIPARRQNHFPLLGDHD